jgi:hypothetical protein
MKANEIVDRVIKDPDFAAELTRKVSALSSTGNLIGPHNDKNWQEILSIFAESPEELSRLSSVNQPIAGSTTWTVTVTSVLTSGATPAAPITVTSITTMTTVKVM